MKRAAAASSIAMVEQRMGYTTGPTTNRRPGDADRPQTLVGHLPVVMTTYEQYTGWRAKLADAVGMTCVLLTFVIWVVVPVCGGLALLLR